MNPCCCVSLRRGTKITGYLHLVWILIVVAFSSYIVTLIAKNNGTINKAPTKRTDENVNTNDGEKYSDAQIFHGILTVLIFGAIWSIFPILLLLGAYKRNWILCLVWFVFSAGSFALQALFFAYPLLFISQTILTALPFMVMYLLLIPQLYCLWVVLAFMSQLKNSSRQELLIP